MRISHPIKRSCFYKIRKQVFFVFLALVIIILTTLCSQEKEIKTIVIDPGHGGVYEKLYDYYGNEFKGNISQLTSAKSNLETPKNKTYYYNASFTSFPDIEKTYHIGDSGAIGFSGENERDFTLRISKKVSESLKKQGVNVILTREDDRYLYLSRRKEISKKVDPDLFLSIHFNSGENCETIKDRFEAYYNTKESKKISKRILDSLNNLFGYSNIKIEKRDFVVLSQNTPSILLELNFICKEEASEYYKDEKNFDKVADAIVRGIMSDSYKNPRELQRGIYLHWNVTDNEKTDSYISKMKIHGLNTVVIHMKDTDGIIPYNSAVNFAGVINATQIHIKDPQRIVKKFKDNRIYTIAKIDAFKDRKIAGKHPELTFIHKESKEILQDEYGVHVDPKSELIQNYTIELVKEMFSFGFDEVMLDYIRYPAKISDFEEYHTEYTSADDDKTIVIAKFLERVRGALDKDKTVSAAVFGVAFTGNAGGIGQDINKIAKNVDILCPMLYISLNSEEYEKSTKVEDFTKSFLQSGFDQLNHPVKVRPWIQGFSRSGRPATNATRISSQIRAVEEFGTIGWQVWKSDGDYNETFKALELLD